MENTCWWSYFLSFHVLLLFLLEIIFHLQCTVFLILINTMNILLILLLSRFDFEAHVLVSKLGFEIRNPYGVNRLKTSIFPLLIFLILYDLFVWLPFNKTMAYLLLLFWNSCWPWNLEPVFNHPFKKPSHKILKT